MFKYLRLKNPEWFYRKKHNIAIDITSQPTWETVEKSPDPTVLVPDDHIKQKGTNRFRQYIALSIVLRGETFILAILPLRRTELAQLPRKVKKLILIARRYVNIGVVLMDKQFANSNVLPVIDKELKLKYVTPAYRIEKNKILGYQSDKEVFITDAIIKGQNVGKLIIFKKINKDLEYEYLYYLTNIPFTETNAHQIIELYKRRWALESDFKDARHFSIRTTSRDTTIRLFFFGCSTILYNLYVLANLIAIILYLPVAPKKPTIIKDQFTTFINGLEYKPPPK
jgi:hypothetical protein